MKCVVVPIHFRKTEYPGAGIMPAARTSKTPQQKRRRYWLQRTVLINGGGVGPHVYSPHTSLRPKKSSVGGQGEMRSARQGICRSSLVFTIRQRKAVRRLHNLNEFGFRLIAKGIQRAEYLLFLESSVLMHCNFFWGPSRVTTLVYLQAPRHHG